MRLSIIIPSFNRKQELCNLLGQLNNQIVTSIHEIIIIVVIDDSTDGTFLALKKDFNSVIIVNGNGNWWYTRSINEGFNKSKKHKPDYLLLLNDDIVLSDNYINDITAKIVEIKYPAIYGSVSMSIENVGDVTFSGISHINKWVDKTYPYKKEITQIRSASSIKQSLVVPGRGMLISFEIMEQLNGFDPIFLQYQSDYDFCLRALKKGYKTYINEDAVLFGFETKTSPSSTNLNPKTKLIFKSLFKKESRYYFPNRAIYYWRHYYKMLLPIYMLKYLIRIIYKTIK